MKIYDDSFPHLGELIKDVFESRPISMTEFSEALRCERPNLYSIFERRSIDASLLCRICAILEYDFFQHITTDQFSPKKERKKRRIQTKK